MRCVFTASPPSKLMQAAVVYACHVPAHAPSQQQQCCAISSATGYLWPGMRTHLARRTTKTTRQAQGSTVPLCGVTLPSLVTPCVLIAPPQHQLLLAGLVWCGVCLPPYIQGATTQVHAAVSWLFADLPATPTSAALFSLFSCTVCAAFVPSLPHSTRSSIAPRLGGSTTPFSFGTRVHPPCAHPAPTQHQPPTPATTTNRPPNAPTTTQQQPQQQRYIDPPKGVVRRTGSVRGTASATWSVRGRGTSRQTWRAMTLMMIGSPGSGAHCGTRE